MDEWRASLNGRSLTNLNLGRTEMSNLEALIFIETALDYSALLVVGLVGMWTLIQMGGLVKR